MDSRSQLPDIDSFYHDVRPVVADGSQPLVLLVADIDGLDFVLRTFGPAERDSIMRELGHRVRAAASDYAEVYCINHYRYAIVLPENHYGHSIKQADELWRALQQPYSVSGIHYHLDSHVGISHFPDHATTLSELVRTAVFACYQAKSAQSNVATFDHSVDIEERRRFRLILELEKALEGDDEIHLAYQPLIELGTGRCVGVEGLCRWIQPETGLVPPGHFLPFVENTPLMMPLTEATLKLGLRDLASLRNAGFEGHLAINLTATVFRRPDLLERLREHLQFSSVSMSNVHFEITETGIMDQPDRAVDMLSEIRSWGCKIAIDDFGTGHSSLAYLADLPIDIIKVDKHFVQNLDKPWGEAIVSAAVTLADKLDLETVAEGIETEEQYNGCRDLGVPVGQGYYMAKPLFRDEFRGWLDKLRK